MPHESRSRLCVNKNIGCGIPFFINSVIKTIDCVKFKKKNLCRLDFLPALQLQVDEAACYNKNEFNAILTITAQIHFYYRRLVYVEQTTYQMRHFHVCIIFSHKYITILTSNLAQLDFRNYKKKENIANVTILVSNPAIRNFYVCEISTKVEVVTLITGKKSQIKMNRSEF